MSELRRILRDPDDTEKLGADLAGISRPGICIYLTGELGAGKTTLARGYLRALGHRGSVRSPTYTLVETYELAAGRVHHFDLYRLKDPEELEFMGIRDYFDGVSPVLVEWPSMGAGFFPPPDLTVDLSSDGAFRTAVITSGSPAGEQAMEALRCSDQS